MRNIGLGVAWPWRLGARTRKGFLVVHIVSAGAWIGIDVVMAVVVFTALLADDYTKALCYRALEMFVVWPLFASGLVCLASGIVLGLGTKWGLLRYWWVAVKLALNERSPRRAGHVRVATGGERDGRAGPEVYDRRGGLARGGRPDLPADRLDERPAHRVRAGSVQAVGSTP